MDKFLEKLQIIAQIHIQKRISVIKNICYVFRHHIFPF